MMENVYVIKVKTKPPLSSLYPSERRYSASTVGGLSFVHFGLGALSLLLGSLALSLQGPILSVACLVPFVTGLLAWRRWYIDRNIAIFFYGSLFSLLAAALCFVATVFDIAAAAENSSGSLWSLEKILQPPQPRLEEGINSDSWANETTLSEEETFSVNRDNNQDSKINFGTLTPGTVIDSVSNITSFVLRNSASSSERNESGNPLKMPIDDGFTLVSKENFEDPITNGTEDSLRAIKDRVMTFWQQSYQDTSHTRILLTVNVLVASLLEAFWSALSARIALRGMTNRLPESSYANGASGNAKSGVGKRKPRAPKPDILDHDRRFSESLQNLSALHSLRNSGPRLPLPESSREFRERVERFLANQAAHRIVEGSYS